MIGRRRRIREKYEHWSVCFQINFPSENLEKKEAGKDLAQNISFNAFLFHCAYKRVKE